MALVLPLIGFHPTPRRLQTCLLALALTLACGPALAAPASGGDTPSPAGTVQVQDGDMASVLAFRLKPRGATIEQMMLALQRLNPDAFIQGNVNLLRDGAVLRLPSAEEVFSLSPEQARDKVRGQHMAFLGALELPSAQASAPAAQPAMHHQSRSRRETDARRRRALPSGHARAADKASRHRVQDGSWVSKYCWSISAAASLSTCSPRAAFSTADV